MYHFLKGSRIWVIFLAFAFFIWLPNFSSASPGTKITINGQSYASFDPVEIDGRLLVPLESISKALSLSTEINAETAVIKKDGTSLEFTAGLKVVWSNDKVFALDVPPQISNGKFYVPLRFLCESLGANVAYNNQTVEIKYPSDRNNDIVLNFAGDTTLAWSFEEAVGDNFDYPFADAPWFREADITMVNLENPVTDRGYKVPKEFNFRMPPKYVQVLLNGGIDIVNLANNHVWDYGPVGVQDTISYLDAAGVKHVGGETPEAARKPVIIEVKGKRVGFLGFYFDEGNVVEDVSALKQKADVVVVNFHWGVERANYPEAYKIDLAHKAIDVGADLVIGHHPHVLQGMERYNGGVIAYSLGNFIFGGNSRRQHDTVAIQLVIRDDEKIPAIIPVRIMDWQAHWLKGKEGRRVIDSVSNYSKGVQNGLF